MHTFLLVDVFHRGCSHRMGSGVHATNYVSLACSQHIRSGYVHCSPGEGWLLRIGHITRVWMCRICGECSFLLPSSQFYGHSYSPLPLVPPILVSVFVFGVYVPLLPLRHLKSVGCFVGAVLFLCSSWISHQCFSVSSVCLCSSMILFCTVGSC